MRKGTSTMHRGFTIVELLIVVVVIAILAAISIVAYTGIQQRAKNSSRIAVGDQWVKAFKLYEAQSGTKPPSVESAASGAKFCLGTGFPVGGGGVPRCQNVNGTDSNSPAESASATLMAELQTVSELPSTAPIRAPVTGPYLQKNATNVEVRIGIDGSYAIGVDCGGGFVSVWTNGSGSVCQKTI